MSILSPALTYDWVRRRYSYAAMLVAAGVAWAFAGVAGWLLGLPLAVGMVLLGVAHGACDQLVVPAGPAGAEASQAAHAAPNHTSGLTYWLRFLGSYLGLAALVGVLWWFWPAATVAGFFLMTVWHWGSADAPAAAGLPTGWWLTHSLLRGLLLFAVPAWCWPTETLGVINGLLTFVGAEVVAPALFGRVAAGLGEAVLAGHALLWAWYAGHGRWELVRTEMLEVLVLSILFVAIPPRLSVSVYFVFWHSLQHVLRLTGWLGYAGAESGADPETDPGANTAARRGPTAAGAAAELLGQLRFFLRRAAPLLLLSCAALLVLGRLLAPRLPDAAAWFSLALVVASIVTLPHALLVTLVMDAARWRRPADGHGQPASDPAPAVAALHPR